MHPDNKASSAVIVSDGSARWRRRRVVSTFLNVGIFLTPVAAASITLWVLAGFVASVPLVWRVLLLLAASSVAAFVSERLARRLLPLSALLRLTMVFPDRAPSRFSVARQAGHPQVLMSRLESGDLDEAAAAQSILALVGALAAHDRKTRGHSERVRAYTDLLGEELGLAEPDRDRLRWSALLHDIGKLRVDTRILNKPGKPTATEWDALRAHPQHGEELARPLLPWLGAWGTAIVEHHERYDGGGYPHGLAGSNISQGARIISVVDSFETMTAVRAYKKAMSHRSAREELARCAGSQFDPVAVRAFLNVSLPKVLWAMGPVSAALQLPWISTLQYAGSRAIGVSGAAAATTPALAATLAAAVAAPAAAGTPHHHHHSPAKPRHERVTQQSTTRNPASITEPGDASGNGTSLPPAGTQLAPKPTSTRTGPAAPRTPSTPGATTPTPSPPSTSPSPPPKKAAPPPPPKKSAPPPPPKKSAPPPPPKKSAPPKPPKKSAPPKPPKKSAPPPPPKKSAPPKPPKQAT